MEGIIERQATAEEIVKSLKGMVKVSFEHGVFETYSSRTSTGARHVRRSKKKIQYIDGIAHVNYNGRLEKIKATHYTMPSGTSFVASYTIL